MHKFWSLFSYIKIRHWGKIADLGSPSWLLPKGEDIGRKGGMISKPKTSLMAALLQIQLPPLHLIGGWKKFAFFSPMAIQVKALICKQIWQVLVLCNDCSSTSRVKFHIFGHKCSNCNSYNTRVTQKVDSEPQSSSDG